MENFICAVTLIIIIFIFVTVNSLIICNLCDKIIALAEGGDLSGAVSLWEEKKDYISFFAHDSNIDSVCQAANIGAKELCDALREIREAEYLSVKNIF